MCMLQKIFFAQRHKRDDNDPLMFENKAEHFARFAPKQFYEPMGLFYSAGVKIFSMRNVWLTVKTH